jgi:septal ring factor EnvC (AmiA/AmiB activator)
MALMRKPLQIGLIAALAVLAVATVALWTRNTQTSAAYASLQAEQETSRQRYAQTLDAIAEIQDSLNAISVGDANVQMHKTVGAEGKSTHETQQEVLDRIAVMRESIAHNKTRIRQLESSLNKSGIKAAGLQKMVAGLKKSVEEKEQIVAQLTGQVESLQTEVTGLKTEVAQAHTTVQQQDATLEERRRELATVYYVMGDKKDLKNAGLVETKGGVLGMGKTITASGKFDEAQAKAIDTDQETVVMVPSKEARVLSAQPASSYYLRYVGEQTELHITNPYEFRKVKQLVILT